MSDMRNIVEQIEQSESFAQIKNAGILPEPDADEGYYFISYSHKDYKKVFKDILAFHQNSLPIWYDRGLESGKSWINEVKKKMTSYYCRGIIFYISENYLASESCMTELVHWMQNASKSALFVTLDGEIGWDENNRLAAPVLQHAPESAVLLMPLMLVNNELPYEASIQDKIAQTAKFDPPELFEYTYVHGTNNPALQTYNMFLGRSAFVSGIVDKNVSSVTLPSTVVHDGQVYRVHGIESNAFHHCTQLQEVIVPDGWMFVLENAFVHCPSLKKVKLGVPGKLVGSRFGFIQKCFMNCPQATLEVAQDKYVSYNGTFKNNNTLTHVDFGGKKNLSGDCFSGCTSLQSARLYKKDSMSDKMFYNCVALQEVSVTKSNRSFWLNQTFYNCESLRHVTLPPKLRKIGNQTFAGCSSLCEITIPKKVSLIEADAFSGCTSLKTVVLNCKHFSTLHKIPTPFRKIIYLDDIFGAATRIYLKHPPKNKTLFRFDSFEKIKSDRRGYTLYQRRETT